MADDPVNQKQFDEDVAKAAAAGNGESFVNYGDPNAQLPNVDEVWKIIEQMEGISDEERANIRDSLFNPPDGTPGDFMKRYAQPAMAQTTSWDYMIFLVMIAIIVLVFALFGYKLYKSLMEKELKKQEKLKNKQSKKAKKQN